VFSKAFLKRSWKFAGQVADLDGDLLSFQISAQGGAFGSFEHETVMLAGAAGAALLGRQVSLRSGSGRPVSAQQIAQASRLQLTGRLIAANRWLVDIDGYRVATFTITRAQIVS
jgi:hypothetical protein